MACLIGKGIMRSAGDMKNQISFAFLSLLPLVFAQTSFAMCLDGRHPSVEQELKSSAIVAVVQVSGGRDIPDPSDPDGISSTFYDVAIIKTFKGFPGHRIKLTSENTSSRFPMDIGKKYLVFVTKMSELYFVDSCGNSRELSRSGAAMDFLKNANAEPH
jgi:hypothetical protein